MNRNRRESCLVPANLQCKYPMQNTSERFTGSDLKHRTVGDLPKINLIESVAELENRVKTIPFSAGYFTNLSKQVC